MRRQKKEKGKEIKRKGYVYVYVSLWIKSLKYKFEQKITDLCNYTVRG